MPPIETLVLPIVAAVVVLAIVGAVVAIVVRSAMTRRREEREAGSGPDGASGSTRR